MAAVYGEERVNSYTDGFQHRPQVAALTGGGYVAAWESRGQEGSAGIYAQRFDAVGRAVGGEFRVNTLTAGDQGDPAITGLVDGGFLIAWTDWSGADGSSAGVYAQRYDAVGLVQGPQFQLNTTTSSTQYGATVASLPAGGFVATWSSYNLDDRGYSVYSQRFDATDSAVGAELKVNTTTFLDQREPRVATFGDGSFVVVWQSYYQDGSDYGIYGQRYTVAGVASGSEFKINTFSRGEQSDAQVTVLVGGGFVVTWTSDGQDGGSYGVYAQRFNADGTVAGAEFRVNESTVGGQYQSSVAALANGGFVVSWYNDNYGVSASGSTADVYVREYNAAGVAVYGQVKVNTTGTNAQFEPAVAHIGSDNYVVLWRADGSQDGSDSGVYQQLFGSASELARSVAPSLGDFDGAVIFSENLVNAAPQLIDATVRVIDADSANFDGGRLTVSVVGGYSGLNQDIGDFRPDQDRFSILSEGNGSSQINVQGTSLRVGSTEIGNIVLDGQGRDLVVQFNASATQALVELVIERLAYSNPSTDPVESRLVSIVVSDGDGGTSAPWLVTINVVPQTDGAEPLFQPSEVNTYQTSIQSTPAIGKLADGGYVIAWQSAGQDGWDDGIFAQRYAANGTPMGSEFKVSGVTPQAQDDPVLTGLADGGWVVAYTSGSEVLAQRFDTSGSKVGREVLVNTFTSGSQFQPAVSAAGSGYVVAWISDITRDSQYFDVFFQRFDADGNRVGDETRASAPIAGNRYIYQVEPDIQALANGNFVVTWRSDGQDGSGSGVFGQLFNGHTSAAIGTEFRFNQYTDDNQHQPKLATFGSGFVAVWTSRGQDNSGDGIYARIFDAGGKPVGSEFRVNEVSDSDQNNPEVAATGDGGFVVTWYSDSAFPYEIQAQKFSATGARIDGVMTISTESTSAENLPVVVGLAGNAFVVAWQADGDSEGSGVFQRIVGESTQFRVSASPQISDLVTTVTFQENAVNVVPQVIDPDIGLLDVDSANFDGGRLDVSFITTYGNQNQYSIPGIQAQDQLGIRDEGAELGKVGVRGTTITYGGTAIGTITGNGVDGAPLTVVFNANATIEAVERVIENLTYQNYLSNPEPTRTVSMRLSDGEGGVTAPLVITLNVVQNPDGAVLLRPEQSASNNQPNTQTNPSIANLASGGYVVTYVDQSGLDGSSYAVYARVYDANDSALSEPFRVNATTTNTQDEPDVVGLYGGGFAVIWTSNGNTAAGANQDSSGDGVYMRRFDASGIALDAADLRVNTSTSGNQYQPAVTQSSDGGYIVAWYSDGVRDGQGYDVFFQRFNAMGLAVGSEVRANTILSSNAFIQQSEPAIALINGAGGDFVVTWTSYNQDGSSYDVYAQRFNADGSKDGTEFRVNSYVTGAQYESSIAALKDGGFVISWTSRDQDGSGAGVYAQLYDRDGLPVRAEFRVNYLVSGEQYNSSVTSLVNGGFAVSWTDGSNIWVQQYDVGGREVDSPIVVNDINKEYGPDIAFTDDGGFLVAYTGYRDSAHRGNNSYEVLVQRYNNPAPVVSDVNVVGREDADIPLFASLFEAGFNDAEGQTLAAVRIITLPDLGVLYLDGVVVVAGQEVDVTSLAAGKLVYRGDSDYVGADQFRWAGSDGNVFAAETASIHIMVNNVNDGPRLAVIPDRFAREGDWFFQNINLSDPDVGNAYRITVNWGYSDSNGPVVTTFTTDSKTPEISHIFPDNGSYTVTVTVDDQQRQPNSVETDSFVVNVGNVMPVIGLSGSVTVIKGDVYTLTLGDVLDPGSDTVMHYAINWGDGSSSTASSVGALTHVYASTGTPTITVSLTDEDGTYTDVSSLTVSVINRPTLSTSLTLPTSLAPGESGLATLNYASVVPEDQDGVLVLVSSKAALLRDPLTGDYSDSLLLIGRGDGVGKITSGETGVLQFDTKMANSPRAAAEVSVAIVTPGTTIDFAELSTALRPAFISDAAWLRIYGNFLLGIGNSTAGLISALSENSAFFQDLGATSTSGTAAWAFELEQAGDFGSIAERAASGSLGSGWAFIGDVALEIATDGNVAWHGSTNLDALFSLNASSAAQYIVSSSVGVSVGLGGGVSSGAPANRPVFVKNIDGSYATDTAFDGTLVKTADGYELRTGGGALLRFGADGQLDVVVSATGREVHVTHDALGRITGFAGAFDNALSIVRDAAGRVMELVDEYGATTAFSYTGDQLTQATGVAGTASFSYSAAGDLTSVAPPGESTTRFQYDSQGRLAGIERAGESVAAIAYDNLGGYTWTSAEGQQASMVLAPGGVASAVSAEGTAVGELVYDANGKLAGAQLGDGSQLSFGIDDQGRLTSVTDPTGATVRYAYTGDSTRPSAFIDATSTTRAFSYDADGRLTEATWGDGSSLQFNYDAEGLISGYTNRRGDATTYKYDARGQLVSRTEAGGETVYTYDSLGRVTAATGATGTTEIGYDSANHITHITYPDGRSLDYAYDEAGRRSVMTDQDGNVQAYSYDAAGRLSSVSYNGSQVVAYGYDGDGRLTTEANGNGTTTTYSYDALGQLTAIVNLATDGTESSAYRYSYDVVGQRVGMDTPHGSWAYGYDGAGQLTSALFSVNAVGTAAGLADKSLVYAYDAAGNRTSVVDDGVHTVYASNALNQYTRVGDTTYTYDADGNQTSKTVAGETWSYAYDANNRLVQITDPDGGVTQYEYDVFGNRSAVVENGVRTEFLVDPFALGMGSPVAEYSGGERVASYLYGLNAIAQQTTTGTYYFEGDAVGSVTGVTGAGGTVTNAYVYDPFGRELMEYETVASRLEFNGLFGVEEADAGLSFMRARYYDPGQGRFAAEDPLWISGDVGNLNRFALNNPVSLVDPEGLYTQAELDAKLAHFNELLRFESRLGHVSYLGPAVSLPEYSSSLDRWTDFAVGLGQYGLGLIASKISYAAWEVGLLSKVLGSGLKNIGEQKVQDAWYNIDDDFPDAVAATYLLTVQGPKSGTQIAELAKAVADALGDFVLSSKGWIAGKLAEIGYSDGDPHLQTFDGLAYDFQAAGEFILARGTNLEIQIRQEPLSSSTVVSVNTAVAMQVGDAVVGLYLGEDHPLNINGEWVELANGEAVSVGGGSVYRNASLYIITNPAGDGIWARVNESFINVRAFVGNERGDDVAGLLGNNDGNAGNDIALADGTVLAGTVAATRLYGEYADSWRVTNQTTLFIYGDGESTATYINRDFPARGSTLADLDPALRAAAEQAARDAGYIEGTIAFENAVLDIALTGDPTFLAGVGDLTTGGAEPTVLPVQRAPDVVNDSASTSEDTAVTIEVLGNDSDPEGDTLQVVAASDASGGTVVIDAAGQLVFTPAPDFHGTTELRYTVSDGAGNAVQGGVGVTVEAVNDAPVGTHDSYATGAGLTLNIAADSGVLANDVDVDGNLLSVVSFDPAANGVLTLNTDGSFSYTPNVGFSGVERVIYRVGDGSVTVESTLSITVAAPVDTVSVPAGGDADLNEGETFTRTIVFSDGEDNGAAGWSYSIDYGDGSMPVTGTTLVQSLDLAHRYADGMATHGVSVTVVDESGESANSSFQVRIANFAPTAQVGGAATVAEGAVFALSVGAIVDPGTDTRSGYSIDWGDGSVSTFTPAEWAAAAGSFTHVFADGAASPTITVSATDEDGSFVLGTHALSVTNVAPTLDVTGAASATVGLAYTLNLSNYVDPGTDTILPDGLVVDWGDGTTSTYGSLGDVTHIYGAAATPTITVSLIDEDGRFVVGSQAVTVVPPVTTNRAPVADDEVYSLRANQSIDIAAPGVLDGDTDADGDALTVQSVDVTGLQGTLSQFADGSLSFTAAAGFTGTTGLTYTVTDGLGGFDSGTVTFNVVNAAPVAGNDSYSVHAGTPLVVTSLGVLGNDSDADVDALFVSVLDASGLDGSLTLSVDGSFSFAPTAGFSGTTGFTYTVADGFGGSDVGTVTINVTNTAPVTDNETLYMWANGSLDIAGPSVLTGDIDADGDALVVQSVDVSGLQGTLAQRPDGGLYFTATPGFTGTTGYTYSVADGNGGFNTASVTINVLAEPTTTTRVGDAPVRQSGAGGQWAAAWNVTGIDAAHKHDVTNVSESWTAVAYHGVSPQNLSGGDVYMGDLGVSGQSVATSSVRQEIDGKEGLRFNLDDNATGVTVNLSRFFINDDGSLFTESGRLRLLDDSGNVVAETTFSATSATGTQQVSLDAAGGFSAVELVAGAYDGTDFVFGGYENASGGFGSAVTTDGAGSHGSDFMVDWVEFDFPVIGVPLPPNDL